MNEDTLIYTFFDKQKHDVSLASSVVLGIGDDAAVMDVPEGYQLVVSTDTLLEGRHFPENYSPEHLASRTVGVTVSDLAAMGAIPKWATLSIALPEVDEVWLAAFSKSLLANLDTYQMHLVGGDTVKGNLSVTLTVMGIIETGQALQRDTAQIDDDIYVSGHLGASAFALFQMLAETQVDTELRKFFDKPYARTKLGRELRTLANSCMDISDGVLLDLSRLLTRSGLGAKVDLDCLPLARNLLSLDKNTQLKLATSGDDYELLFTAPRAKQESIRALSDQLGISLTHIGRIVAESGLQTFVKGQAFEIEQLGYQHF